jgi:putative ABC transport system permease protein
MLGRFLKRNGPTNAAANGHYRVALPIGKLLSDAIGVAFLDAPLNYTFSIKGTLFWLVVVLILSAMASFLPARSASRLTVREVLAYE